MKPHLLKLFLIGLLCAAWPECVSAETQMRQAVCLSSTEVAKEKKANVLKDTAQLWDKPTEPTEFEVSITWLSLALLVISTVGVIAGLIDGRDVFIGVLLMGISILTLFVLSRILRARGKKSKGASSKK